MTRDIFRLRQETNRDAAQIGGSDTLRSREGQDSNLRRDSEIKVRGSVVT